MGQPRWNVYDTAYGIAGLLVVLFMWGAYDTRTAAFCAPVLLLVYVAGRAAGSHR